MKKIKKWLQSLSFRTGVIVLALCVPFYLLSFAQMLLPISAELKGVLWFVLLVSPSAVSMAVSQSSASKVFAV